MVNIDSEEGQQIFSTEQTKRPNYRFILVTESMPYKVIDQYWVLTKKSHAPPSLKELTKLLNEVAEVLGQEAKLLLAQTSPLEDVPEIVADAIAEEPEQQTTARLEEHEEQTVIADNTKDEELPTATSSDTIDFTTLPPIPKNSPALTRPLYARNYFFGMLVQARKDKACRAIKQNKLPNLFLAPSDNSYYFAGSATDLLAYCTAMPQYLEEVVITKQKLAKMLKSGQLSKKQPLEALVVYAIIEVSQGRLLEGHSAEQAFTLIQMPDFGQIPMLSEYKRVADYLYKQTSNLFQASEALKKPLSAMFDCYNVCYLLGYITIEKGTKLDAINGQQTSRAVMVEKKTRKVEWLFKKIFSSKRPRTPVCALSAPELLRF
jgi:hypothetical protein